VLNRNTGATTEEKGNTGRVGAGLNATIDRLTAGGFSGYFSETVDSVMARFHGADSLASIVKFTPELRGYQHGSDYVTIPLQVIVPRTIWRNKPQRFATEFGNLYFAQPGNTSYAITAVGDLYMNFGVAGIMFGSLLLGAFFRFVYELLVNRSDRSDVGLFVYIALYSQLVIVVESELAPVIGQILKATLVLAFISWFMSVAFEGQTQRRAGEMRIRRAGVV
jgi:hypothetical protein